MPVDALFGNVHCISAQMSSTVGIAPDVGTLVLPLTARIPSNGDLLLRDGNGGSVLLRDIYVLSGTLRIDPGGETYSVQIADSRCLWQHGHITGRYNQPLPDGTENQEKTLYDLLTLTMQAVPGTPVGSINASLFVYPPVDWDVDQPAQAAQALCDGAGLQVMLLPSGPVTIGPAWTIDPAWPAGSIEQAEDNISQQVKPGVIRIIGARRVRETWFEDLIPVGQEIDGTIRPINDLSYKPAGGWPAEPVPTFPNVASGTYGGESYTAEEARELARKCIWRWYALPLTEAERKRYLPLLDIRSEVAENRGEDAHAKPYIISENALWDGTQWTRDDKGRISTNFSIDNELGIVKFDEPVYSITNDGGSSRGDIKAPDMDLRAAYEEKWYAENVWNAPFGDPGRYVYIHNLPGGIAGAILNHSVPELREYYIDAESQNAAELDAYAKQIALALAKQFDHRGPMQRVYPRIVLVWPQGTIKSVQWSVDGSSGAQTTVQKNFDAPALAGMPTYEEKLRRRRERVLIEQSQRDLATARFGRGSLGGTF